MRCDEHGKVIDDGTIARLSDDAYRWTAADPTLRWLRMNALGLDVEIEEITEQVAALALQGPMSRAVLEAATGFARRPAVLPAQAGSRRRTRRGPHPDGVYRRPRLRAVDRRRARRRPVGRGDRGRAPVRHPAGGDAGPGRRQDRGRSHPHRGRLLERAPRDHRRAGLLPVRAEPRAGWSSSTSPTSSDGRPSAPSRPAAARRAVWWGSRSTGRGSRAMFAAIDLPPAVPSAASRTPVPIYARGQLGRGGGQVGKATSTTWSPTLKSMIALASVDAAHATTGTRLEVEWTVEARRGRVGARVVDLPFYDPPRKRAEPRGRRPPVRRRHRRRGPQRPGLRGLSRAGRGSGCWCSSAARWSEAPRSPRSSGPGSGSPRPPTW